MAVILHFYENSDCKYAYFRVEWREKYCTTPKTNNQMRRTKL